MKKTYLGILLIVIAFTIIGVRVAKKVTLKQNVTGHLKRAADASTIDLAKQELTTVIDYLEAQQITEGYTSILWKTPDEDISFWYKNIKASKNELENLKSESALEKTNVLMKLRESLVDSGKRTRVTIPSGLNVFPYNKFWAGLSLTTILFFFTGFILIGIDADQYYKAKAKCKPTGGELIA